MDSLPNLGLLGLSKARGAPPDERKLPDGRAVVDYREARLVAREKEMEKARALFECALKLSFLRAPRETPAHPYPPNIFTPDIVLSQKQWRNDLAEWKRRLHNFINHFKEHDASLRPLPDGLAARPPFADLTAHLDSEIELMSAKKKVEFDLYMETRLKLLTRSYSYFVEVERVKGVVEEEDRALDHRTQDTDTSCTAHTSTSTTSRFLPAAGLSPRSMHTSALATRVAGCAASCCVSRWMCLVGDADRPWRVGSFSLCTTL